MRSTSGSVGPAAGRCIGSSGVRRFLSEFRAEAGPRLGEFSYLVNRLLEASAAFRAGWESHGIEGFTSRERLFHHPMVGDLHLDHHRLAPATTPNYTSSSTPRSQRPTPPPAWPTSSASKRYGRRCGLQCLTGCPHQDARRVRSRRGYPASRSVSSVASGMASAAPRRW